MVDRVPVIFTNTKGQKLFGILHLPEPSKRRDVAIVLLSPGVKMRVGPHRLYNAMAQRYADLGFPVLRFDFWGLGDSEGEVTEEQLADLYGNVQVGRYVDDTRSAMNWMQQHLQMQRFVLGGLCGGAITGLLSGANDKRVAGLLAIGMPVTVDGSNVDKSRYVTVGQLRRMRSGYLRKLMSPGAWLRFLSFKTDYRVLLRSLFQQPPGAGKAPVAKASAFASAADNLNTLFPEAFVRLLADGRPMLLIFGGTDRLLWEFEEKFLQRHGERCKRHQGSYSVHTISGANHILSSPEAKAEMLAATEEWLQLYFAPDRVVDAAASVKPLVQGVA